MPNAAAFISGGLLSGVGKGMILQGKEKREAAREALRLKTTKDIATDRNQLTIDLADERDAAAMERDEAKRVFKADENLKAGQNTRASDAVKARNTRDENELNRKSKERIAAGKGKRGGLLDGSGNVSAADKRAVDIVKGVHTNKMTGITNWPAVIKQLHKNGRKDLAEFVAVDKVGPGGVTMVQAHKLAKAEAEKRKEYLKSRKQEFPSTKGDPFKWTNNRTVQIFENGPDTPPPPLTPPASSKTPKDGVSAEQRDSIIGAARNAIAKGATRSEVEKRLRKLGIDPKYL